MKYIALLRGINIGGNRKVEMSILRTLFQSLRYTDVATYINSGNVIFESNKKQDEIQTEIEHKLGKEFGFEIQTLIKTKKEMKIIAAAIPENWHNDSTYKTDVAYLFPEIDSKKTINDLPVNKEFIDLRYVKGAIYWNIERKNYNKSRLNKLIGHKLYRLMTIRNINTARYLAEFIYK